MIKKVMATVEVASDYRTADGTERWVRLVLVGEELATLDTLHIAVNEAELTAFRERVGKIVCLTIEDA